MKVGERRGSLSVQGGEGSHSRSELVRVDHSHAEITTSEGGGGKGRGRERVDGRWKVRKERRAEGGRVENETASFLTKNNTAEKPKTWL